MTSERKEMIVFLGPPGVGKGTQAKILSQKYNLTHISTGDLVRHERASGSELGNHLEQIGWSDMDALDTIVLTLLERQLEQHEGTTVILDGCPRTVAQAENLEQILSRSGRPIAQVIAFYADDAALIGRLTSRFACAGCGEVYHAQTRRPLIENCCDICGQDAFYTRPEDTEAYARDRLARFGERIRPVLDYYARTAPFSRIDGNSPVDHVTAQLCRTLCLE